MATTFDLTLALPSASHSEHRRAERTLEDAHRLVSTLELQWSEFIPTSETTRLNELPANTPFVVSDRFLELTERALYWMRETKGAFNPLFRSHEPGTVIIDQKNCTLTKTHAGVYLSFGAIGKGAALDACRTLIEQQGFENYALSAGGSSLILSGYASHRQPWPLGWSWKKDPSGALLGQSFLCPSEQTLAFGISGVMEKGEHIVPQALNRNEESAPSSVLIALSGSAADADALSTAYFVGGIGAIPETLRSRVAHATLQNDIPTWNERFRKWFGPITTASASVALSLGLAPTSFADEVDLTVDLGEMGGTEMPDRPAFEPYSVQRQPEWIALPVFALALVLLHLRSNRYRPQNRLQKKKEPVTR